MTIEKGLNVSQFVGSYKARLLDDNEQPISGFFPFGGTTEFNIKTAFDTKDVPGFDEDTFGTNIAVIDNKKPAEVSIKNNTMSDMMMSIALNCKLATQIVINADAVAGEQHLAWEGQQIQLANPDALNVVINTPANSGATGFITASLSPVGTKKILVDTGSGTGVFLAGDTIAISGLTGFYIVESPVDADGFLTIKGGLVEAEASGAAAITVQETKTLTAGTDYEINPLHPEWIEIKAAAALGRFGAPLLVDYDYPARTETTFTSGEQPFVVEVIGDVYDRQRKQHGKLHMPKLKLISNSVLKFITGNDVAELDFNGMPLKSNAYGYDFKFTKRE